MSTFGLVHGAWHGAWCFDDLIPELEAAGHEAVAVDMPIDTVSTPADWARVVVSALEDKHDLVLVGHSMAGLVIPLVAEALPVRQLTYLAGVLRGPGRSLAQDYEDGVGADMTPPEFTGEGLQRGDGFTWWDPPQAAVAAMYHDCKPETARLAASKLRRQYASHWTDVSPQQDWPRVPAAYVLGQDDRVVSATWARRVVPQWLGVKPIELPGGHSPFLARPRELARVLTRIAASA